jgi:hypothetical protein
MTNPTIADYKKVCSILTHIPKRERAKAKRKIKRYALSVLDPTHQNRSEALRTYRRSWQEFAAGEGKERPWVAPTKRQK